MGLLKTPSTLTCIDIWVVGVAEANKSLKGGDQKAALEKLKLVDVNMDIILGMVPVNPTFSNVRQASELIAGSKYYEASQMLRAIQNSERFDVADISAAPQANAAASSTGPAVATARQGSAPLKH